MVAAVEDHRRETSVEEVSTIVLDLAKHVFQAHRASASGAVLFRKRLRREQVLRFFASQPRCRVAMEACASGHYWARAISDLGHEVRLIPPAYVKPFVKRQKNDMADAEAICEAAQRPTMRFVAVKSEAKQATAVIFRARDLLVGQRTQIINALRGHLAEYGLIAPQGPSHIERLIAQIEDPASGIPEVARSCLGRLIEMLRHLQNEITTLDREITVRAKSDDVARRLMTILGIGPLIATAIEALAPPSEIFSSGRDFAAWIGLTPVQRSTGGKERLGRTSRMGERTLRRLLIFCGQRRRALGQTQRCPARLLACAHAREQAADAGDRRLSEQERPRGLGTDHQGRDLPSSSRCRMSGRRR
jgi:transposase